MKKNNYITPDGFRRLQEEFEFLAKSERPKITELVTWAASNGDRSENADYQYGKRRLREIDRRLRFLSQRIEAAVIVNPTEIKSKNVQFGATVVIETEDGQRKKISIVGVDEIDTAKGHLSWQSPLARGLLGKSTDDEVEIETPDKKISWTIIQISYVKLS